MTGSVKTQPCSVRTQALRPFLLALLLPALAFADFATQVQPFIKQHCVECHGPDKQKGRLRLDTLSDDFSDSHTAATWIEVRDNLNLGEMPPEDEPRPPGDGVIAVAQWIAGQLKAMQAQANSTGGKVLLRRMTRTEYTNTVRDLLHISFVEGEGPADILPPDGKIGGFDKVSKALLLDPSLMENYLQAARWVADRAIVTRPPRVRSITDRFEFEDIPNTAVAYQSGERQLDVVENGVNLYQGGARTAGYPRHPYSQDQVPIIGKYTYRVRAGAFQGDAGKPVFMEIHRRNIKKRFEVKASIENPQVYEFTTTVDPTESGEWQVSIVNGTQMSQLNMDSGNTRTATDKMVLAGDAREAIRIRSQLRAEGLFTDFQVNQPSEASRDKSKLPRLFIDYFEIEGPLQEDFPPASTRLLYPNGHDNTDSHTLEAAEASFKRLMARAFRRRITRSELQATMDIVKAELDLGGTFHDAMKIGLVSVLASPDFIFIIEPSDGNRRPLNNFELASRLSYFLWSSMPDNALYRQAVASKLSDPAVLEAEVERMLADPKSEALVADFANQWLHIDEFDKFKPDEGIYKQSYYAPRFGGIARDMEEEARAFFREIMRKDASVLNFLNSDWIMANEKLATYYGIEGVEGEAFRRVSLPTDSPRGGIIGMAGFHKWGADGARTKPVERGKYLLSVLFNDPPDPPPPNAGEVEPNVQGERLTVRERLLRHQEVEACAGCHKTIDPYGLAMENFNVVGLWRDVQDGEQQHFWTWNPPPVIASGTLPNGKAFADFAEFKELLTSQTARFERGLAEKMYIYALARTLEPSDDAVLADIVTRMGQEGHSMSSLIKGIVRSEAFGTK